MIQKKWILIFAVMMGAGTLIFSGVSRADDEPQKVDVKFALQMEGNPSGEPMTIKLDKPLQMTGNVKKSALKLPANPQIYKVGSSKKSEERLPGKKSRPPSQSLPGQPGMAEQEE